MGHHGAAELKALSPQQGTGLPAYLGQLSGGMSSGCSGLCLPRRPAAHSSGQPLRFLFFLTCSPARVAISKTSRTPSFVLAEHSR